MARKKAHEDHVNHEAWAIPYGDMLVLLLALFVVMYAVSSVNEGKYRVLADSLSAEFSGAPRAISPIQFGSKQTGAEADSRSSIVRLRAAQTGGAPPVKTTDPVQSIQSRLPMPLRPTRALTSGAKGGSGAEVGANAAINSAASLSAAAERRSLEAMGAAIKGALGDLVKRDLVRVRASSQMLEVEIRADILYPSGSAQLVPSAQPVLAKLADILARFPNAVRIEGHTDSLPISSSVYPSNWELSAARAASVVHLFAGRGIKAPRLSVTGFAEFRPVSDNSTVAGRNRNRRVVVVVLSREGEALPINEAGGIASKTRSPLPAVADAGMEPTSAAATASKTISPRSAKAVADRPAGMISLPNMHPQVKLSVAEPVPAAAPVASHAH